MSKERLEEVKYAWHIDGDISDYHFYWLIEQAERAEQNKKDWLNTMKRLENYEKVASLNHEEIQRLREQNKLYQEAMQELKEYLESTIPKMPTNEKPLILTKSLEIVNRALKGD